MGVKNLLIDLTGEEFGIWRVIEQAPRIDNKTRWLCQCKVCGAKRSLRSTVLRRSTYNRCDGRHVQYSQRIASPKRKPSGYAACTEVYNRYRKAAERRSFEFRLSREEFECLAQQECHYCGRPPEHHVERRHFHGAYIHNGIDRIDSKAGYSLENCLPCCFLCNTMKSNLAYEEFLQHLALIVSRHQGSIDHSNLKPAVDQRIWTERPANMVDKTAVLLDPNEHIERAKEARRQGKTMRQIAAELNVSLSQVYRFVGGAQKSCGYGEVQDIR